MAQELHVFTEADAPAEAMTNALQGIKAYLDERAQTDAVFAIKYLTSGKTLIGAVRYLAHKNLDNVVLKGEKANGKTFDFAINSDAADNELAAEYFMDDTLDYEKGAEPAKAKTPKEPKPKKEKKTTTTKTTIPNTPQTYVKPSTPVSTPATAAPVSQPTDDEEVIDLFAGLFD